MPVSNRSSAPMFTEPDRLRLYAFHGVDLAVSGTQAIGDCPFCGREAKFSVEIATGLWRCWTCQAGTQAGGGNGLVFTRLIYDRAAQANVAAANGIRGAFLAAVAADRRLLSPATVAAWGVAQAADGVWLVPGYSAEGRLDQVYRRVRTKRGDGWAWCLMPTPGLWGPGKVHALHLPAGDFDPARPNVVVCEGPWDGMALWEVWDHGEGRNTNIVAVPGCGTWRDEWTAMCRGKCVTLLYDSDHPPTLGGYKGMVRVAKRLSGVAASVRYIRWGEEGWDASKPSGWDVRDHLTSRQAGAPDRTAY